MTDYLLEQQLDTLRSISSDLKSITSLNSSSILQIIQLVQITLIFILILIVSILYITSQCRIGRRMRSDRSVNASNAHLHLLEDRDQDGQ